MINAHRLIFNGFSTEDFDVTPHLSFGGDSGATPSFLNREGVYTEHYDGHRTIHRSKFNEALTPRFTLIKNDFSDFDAAENRKVLSWLTASDKPGWLEVYEDDSNVLSWRVFGCITSVEQYKLGNGRVVGYEFEIESTHPYAWSRLLRYPADPDNLEEIADYLQISEPTTFTITCNSDEYNKLLYPKVTIQFNDTSLYVTVNDNPTVDAYKMMPNVIYIYDKKYYVSIDGNKHQISSVFSGSVKDQTSDENTVNKYYYCSSDKTIYKSIVINEEDSARYDWESIAKVGAGVQIENSYTLNGETKHNKTTVIGGTLNEEIVFDGANKILSSSVEPMRIIGDDFNWVWPAFSAGENTFTITGNCKVKFEWIEPRKVGSL